MIFKIFSPKNLAKNSAFFTPIKGKFAEKVIITLVFEKNANFFAENVQKSQKIVIITSTPELEMDRKNFRIKTVIARKSRTIFCRESCEKRIA
jgi:hypothetical protein